MEWHCACGEPVTTMEVLWQWMDMPLGQGRYVAYGVRIGCNDCVRVPEPVKWDLSRGPEDNYQYFALKFTAETKEALVKQILAEILSQRPRGHVPKTDLKDALRHIRMVTWASAKPHLAEVL